MDSLDSLLLPTESDEIRPFSTQSNKLKFSIPPLTNLQEEIIYAIETQNINYFADIGGTAQVDLNYPVFKAGAILYPILISAAKGNGEFIKVLIQNPNVDISVVEPETGVNAFWIAAFYGHGQVMGILAEKGIDIFNVNKTTGSNVLHIATQKNYTNVVNMLIQSKFPLDLQRNDGFTAVHIASQKKETYPILKLLTHAGANINILTQSGIGSLFLALNGGVLQAVKFLVSKGAQMYYQEKDKRDLSPIYIAIQKQDVKAIEFFCDHGADLSWKDNLGQTPLIFAAKNQYDEIVNYLTLRAKNLNVEDKEGLTIMTLYLLKQKISMVKKLLIRGADINYRNKFGKTALHYAVENDMPEQYIRFLLQKIANPHFEDALGWDVCSKAKTKYPNIKEFRQCTPQQRIKFDKQVKKVEEPDSPLKTQRMTQNKFGIFSQNSDDEVDDNDGNFKYGHQKSADSDTIQQHLLELEEQMPQITHRAPIVVKTNRNNTKNTMYSSVNALDLSSPERNNDTLMNLQFDKNDVIDERSREDTKMSNKNKERKKSKKNKKKSSQKINDLLNEAQKEHEEFNLLDQFNENDSLSKIQSKAEIRLQEKSANEIGLSKQRANSSRKESFSRDLLHEGGQVSIANSHETNNLQTFVIEPMMEKQDLMLRASISQRKIITTNNEGDGSQLNEFEKKKSGNALTQRNSDKNGNFDFGKQKDQALRNPDSHKGRTPSNYWSDRNQLQNIDHRINIPKIKTALDINKDTKSSFQPHHQQTEINHQLLIIEAQTIDHEVLNQQIQKSIEEEQIKYTLEKSKQIQIEQQQMPQEILHINHENQEQQNEKKVNEVKQIKEEIKVQDEAKYEEASKQSKNEKVLNDKQLELKQKFIQQQELIQKKNPTKVQPQIQKIVEEIKKPQQNKAASKPSSPKIKVQDRRSQDTKNNNEQLKVSTQSSKETPKINKISATQVDNSALNFQQPQMDQQTSLFSQKRFSQPLSENEDIQEQPLENKSQELYSTIINNSQREQLHQQPNNIVTQSQKSIFSTVTSNEGRTTHQRVKSMRASIESQQLKMSQVKGIYLQDKLKFDPKSERQMKPLVLKASQEQKLKEHKKVNEMKDVYTNGTRYAAKSVKKHKDKAELLQELQISVLLDNNEKSLDHPQTGINLPNLNQRLVLPPSIKQQLNPKSDKGSSQKGSNLQMLEKRTSLVKSHQENASQIQEINFLSIHSKNKSINYKEQVDDVRDFIKNAQQAIQHKELERKRSIKKTQKIVNS